MGSGITLNLDLDKDQAIGLRTAMGITPKNRVDKNVRIEKELLEIHKQHNPKSHNGALSNDVNIGLNYVYARRGWI